MCSKKTIAILGATSHIAKNLIARFDAGNELVLFGRCKMSLLDFIDSVKPASCCFVKEYYEFFKGHYDVVINCVGVANPKVQKEKPYEIFLATERFDNMVLDYLYENPKTQYINISSGAVFGSIFETPVEQFSSCTFYPNSFGCSDYYSIAKLNSEIKHRAMKGFLIVDLRIFGFFSKYIDRNSGFLLAEILNALLNNTVFKTSRLDIVRDYIAPDDLFSLIKLVIENQVDNIAFDVVSACPAKKTEILEMVNSKYGLMTEYVDILTNNVSGQKSEYYSLNKVVQEELGFKPMLTSLQGIEHELHKCIERN